MLSNFVKISLTYLFYAIGSGIRIRDPKKIIPDPGYLGSKKGPDPGSATLLSLISVY
jgi:hypothetical protein